MVKRTKRGNCNGSSLTGDKGYMTIAAMRAQFRSSDDVGSCPVSTIVECINLTAVGSEADIALASLISSD